MKNSGGKLDEFGKTKLSRLIFVFLLIYGNTIIKRESVRRWDIQAKLDGTFRWKCIASHVILHVHD